MGNVVEPRHSWTHEVASASFLHNQTCIVSGSANQTAHIRGLTVEDAVDYMQWQSWEVLTDGWLINPSPQQELIFWVPPEYRRGLYWPCSKKVIGQIPCVEPDYQAFQAYGKSWIKCIEPL